MITPEERRRVKKEILRRLDKAMDAQDTVDPSKVPENGIPIYLALVHLLDIILDGNRRADVVIPVRGVNVLNPFQSFDKRRVEFQYKDMIEEILKP